MRIRWCVCDVDGTLMNSANHLTDETMLAVRQMQEAGIELILSTGRSPLFIKELVAKLNLGGPVICCNGGLIRHVGMGQTLFSKEIRRETVLALATDFLDSGVDALMYSDEHIYYNRGSKRAQLYFRFNQEKEPAFQVPLIEITRAEELPDRIIKFFVWDVDAALAERIMTIHNKQGNLYVVQSMKGSLDVMASGVSKGEALRFLAQQGRLQLAQTAVFGDNYNDVSMFELAGLPIAMANGEAAAKQAAKFVARSNDENGVAHAIRRYILEQSV